MRTISYYGRKVPHESCGSCHRNEPHAGWRWSAQAKRWYFRDVALDRAARS